MKQILQFVIRNPFFVYLATHKDKLGHFMVGSLISAWFYLVTYQYMSYSPFLPLTSGVLMPWVAGALKEAYDAWDNERRLDHGLAPQHDVDLMDLKVTGYGCWVAIVFHILIG